MKSILPLIFLALLADSSATAQCDVSAWKFDEGEGSSFSFGRMLKNAMTPQIVVDSRAIRDYLRDPRFRSMTQLCGDSRAVDAIYLKALRIAEYNHARALFLSMMAVLEHQQIDLKLPLIQSLGVPLTLEEDSTFKARLRNIPGHLYPDSPKNGEADKDKLQHFFASAYLAFASESPELARTTGNLVEWAEAKVVVGGADDWRDRRSNEQGKSFGRDLLIVKTLLPSDYLQLGLDKDEP